LHEFVSVSQAARDAVQRGEPVVLASLVRVRGSSPRHGSARMLIWPDGRIAGTIGGGTLEWRVIEHAHLALAEHQSRYTNYVFDTHGGPDSVGLCGGSVDVHIDVQVKEFADLGSAALQALEAGERVVLASIVREGQAAPTRPATRMLIWPDGHTLGGVATRRCKSAWWPRRARPWPRIGRAWQRSRSTASRCGSRCWPTSTCWSLIQPY